MLTHRVRDDLSILCRKIILLSIFIINCTITIVLFLKICERILDDDYLSEETNNSDDELRVNANYH